MTAPIADVVATLDQQRVSAFQIRVAALCAAVVFLDGFDTQVIGNLVPSIIAEWKVTRPAMAPSGTMRKLMSRISWPAARVSTEPVP